jgi:hypothetical protein
MVRHVQHFPRHLQPSAATIPHALPEAQIRPVNRLLLAHRRRSRNRPNACAIQPECFPVRYHKRPFFEKEFTRATKPPREFLAAHLLAPLAAGRYDFEELSSAGRARSSALEYVVPRSLR